ncbi:MAG: hypothetical protein DCC49_10370 [Acidobacteria bacterium]|nr:MAG: hypothetical protein DCC49_10370 [Acidobacteriota bacterium]
MLERLDRIQIAAAQLDEGSAPFVNLLGAEPIGDDVVNCLGARRRTLHAGRSAIEILAPDSDSPEGAVAHFIGRWGPGLFGAGFNTHNFSGLKNHFDEQGTAYTEEAGQLFLTAEETGAHGMPVVITPSGSEELGRKGLIRSIYEITNIVEDQTGVAAQYAQLFKLDAAQFHHIESEMFGYEGTLTLFRPSDRLDRIEVVTVTDEAKTMGRFASKRGESLYMFFVESDQMDEIRDRLREHAPRDWSDSPNREGGDVLFVHPKAASGVLFGVSRTSVGWLWSGAPERVVKAGD